MLQAGPGKYALVLMDMQMPEMDGLAATRAIRGDSRFTDLPIIALTANAMKADLDACLEAGMQDHITKPIERKTLIQTLRRWLPARAPAAAAGDAAPSAEVRRALAAEPAQPGELDGIDIAGAIDRLGLDFSTLKRMLLRYGDGQPAMLEAVRTAVASGDGAAVARHAHTIAGASGNLGADTLRAAAKALEHAAREGGTDFAPLLADLEAKADVVRRSIDTMRAPAAAVAAAAAPAPVTPVARAALTRLDSALGDFDFSTASKALAELDGGAIAGTDGDLARLRQHIDNYEFEEARAITARLLGQTGSDVS
jgi:two-component system sensor histidine kinase/response regulator